MNLVGGVQRSLLLMLIKGCLETMRILVVEDETMVARQLCRIIGEILIDRPHSINHCFSLSEAQLYLDQNAIDLLFLDLNLSGEDGFELLSTMVTAPFHTIVASANVDKALRSYEYGVLDFVPKPFNVKRIEKALTKICSHSEGNVAAGSAKYLGVKYLGKTQLIATDTITHIRADGRYSVLNLGDNITRLHEKNLKELMLILPEKFHRIHKSYLVNLDFALNISSQPGSKYELVLANHEELPIGRTYLSKLKARVAK